jgi:hypothetical protein
MSFLDRLFKKKSTLTKTGLEEALEKGLITKEEFFRLQIERVEQELKDYLLKNKKK